MMILGEFHLWTISNQISIPETDIGCFTYCDKSESASIKDQPYYEEREQFTKSRDIMWLIKNKRPEKLKDCLKEVEELLALFKCVFSQWTSRNFLQLVLNNGILVSIVISARTSDIEKIVIDKFLIGKLISENIVDVLLNDHFKILTFYESKLNFIWFNKKLPLSDPQRKSLKLSILDPKITIVELPSSSVKRLERHLSLTTQQDLLLVWWSTSSDEAWPWTPVTNDRDRANLVVYAINGSQLDLVTYSRTECEPLSAAFSFFQPNFLLTVEQSSAGDHGINIDACTYEVTKTKILQVSSTTIPLKIKVIVCSWNPSEDKLLLGCEDSTLVLYDSHRHITQMIKAAVIPSVISWHPGGTLIFVCNSSGQIQCFDMALSAISLQLQSEDPTYSRTLDLNFYFRYKSPPTLQQIKVCPFENIGETLVDALDVILLIFEKGPLSVLQLDLGVISKEALSPVQLVGEYIRLKKIDEAVNLLSSINWNLDSQSAFRCLHLIVNYLLRMPLTAGREAQLEAALGSFYSPSRPLSDITILEYRDSLNCLARRFFHHLLRYQLYDKAFLLAMDIGARDLFMDIYHIAKDKEELALADAAKQKALQIDSNGIDAEEIREEYVENSHVESVIDENNENQSNVNTGQVPDPPLPYKLPPSAVRVLPDFPSHLNVGITPLPSTTDDSILNMGRPYVPETLDTNEQFVDSDDILSRTREDSLREFSDSLLDGPLDLELSQEQSEEEDQDIDGTCRTVKVVHFGIV